MYKRQGDGTASRETEEFIKKVKFKNDMLVYLVREDGASIYSCLLYTSDAADERSSVDLGGRRIIKKKNRVDNRRTNVSIK